MKDFIIIGSAPYEEDCVQVGANDYARRAKIEGLAFIGAIRMKLGLEPEQAHLAVKSFPHDFGTYYEVVCHYDDTNEKATEYAFKCESEGPATWQEVGMRAPNYE